MIISAVSCEAVHTIRCQDTITMWSVQILSVQVTVAATCLSSMAVMSMTEIIVRKRRCSSESIQDKGSYDWRANKMTFQLGLVTSARCPTRSGLEFHSAGSRLMPRHCSL